VTGTLRVIDSGVTEGRLNIALGQALIERHGEGAIPDTLRFLRFPPTALIGRHQSLAQEVNLDFCGEHHIGLARRITGGGAIFLDPGQLGWELVVRRASIGGTDLTDAARRICTAAASGLGRLGVPARFRPRNDIEVDGRKISGTGGFFDGDTLFFQGTVLVDLDPSVMMSVLNVAKAKLEKHALDSAEQRVVTLRALLGEGCPDMAAIQEALVAGFEEGLGLRAENGALDDQDRALARQLFDEEIGRDEFVNEIVLPADDRSTLVGEHTGAGGTVRTHLRLQGAKQNRIASVLISGDFFVTPPRVVYDLEGALRGLPLDQVAGTLDCFFRDADIEVLSVGKEDFLKSLQAAIAGREDVRHVD
jgi:lipoate-protein ligase A